MHVDLEEALAGNPELTINCHRNCIYLHIQIAFEQSKETPILC